MFFLDFPYLVHFHFQGDPYAEVTLLPFPKRRWGRAGSVLTAKCASCTCAQPGAQSTHYFSVQRGERAGPTGIPEVLHIEVTATAASVQPTLGDPVTGWIQQDGSDYSEFN